MEWRQAIEKQLNKGELANKFSAAVSFTDQNILKSIKEDQEIFYSLEGNEPPHIHVEHGDKVGKFWLNPVNLASSYGFRSHNLGKLRLLITEHRELFLEKWYEHFGN
jgi:hypothetical protein